MFENWVYIDESADDHGVTMCEGGQEGTPYKEFTPTLFQLRDYMGELQQQMDLASEAFRRIELEQRNAQNDRDTGSAEP